MVPSCDFLSTVATTVCFATWVVVSGSWPTSKQHSTSASVKRPTMKVALAWHVAGPSASALQRISCLMSGIFHLPEDLGHRRFEPDCASRPSLDHLAFGKEPHDLVGFISRERS